MISATLLEAQSQSEPTDFHEELDVTLVNVYLTATDSAGNFIADLKAEDLLLKEDGVIQSISYFGDLAAEDSSIPVTVVLLADNSTSMNETFHGQRKIDIVKNAGFLILNELRDQDRMLLVGFDRNPGPVYGPSSNQEGLRNAINSLKVEYNPTALFDAVDFSIKKVKDEPGRKLIVICSDGQDNASQLRLNHVVDESRTATDFMIVALGTVYYDSKVSWFGADEDLRRGKSNLTALADTTGGFTFFPSRTEELKQAMDTMRRLIRSQYTLAYRPSDGKKDGSWRKIEILCKRPGVKLRYREGYYAK